MKIQAIIISLSLLFGSMISTPLFANKGTVSSESQQKIRDIRTLMKITRSSKLVLQILDHTITMYKKLLPDIPDQFWQKIRDEVDEDEVIDLMVPIYARHLTHKEIKELIKFYKSPIGIKMIKITPVIMQEAMIAGQTWGRQLGEKIKKRLEEKGYIDKNNGKK